MINTKKLNASLNTVLKKYLGGVAVYGGKVYLLEDEIGTIIKVLK